MDSRKHLRPGRFDRQVALDRPDIKGREQILKVHAKRLTLGHDVDLAAVTGKTAGLAGADLANIVNEAALHAARKNKTVADMSDFDEAIDRAITGLERKSRVMNTKERETVAYHEAGHALVAESRATADKVAKVSIIPRGIGATLGYTQQQPTEDRYLLKHGELLGWTSCWAVAALSSSSSRSLRPELRTTCSERQTWLGR